MSLEHQTPDDWTDEQRALFGRMFRHMNSNQQMFSHSNALAVLPEHWTTTCWNAAWFAVACCRGEADWTHIDEDGQVLAVEVGTGEMQ